MQLVFDLNQICNNDGKLHFVYLYTNWCVYHKKYLKMLPKLEEEFNIDFECLEASLFKDFCVHISVDSVPTIAVIRNNKVLSIMPGMVMMSAFRAHIQKTLKQCKPTKINTEKFSIEKTVKNKIDIE
jgi:thioredoxin-like negative regulator of GroEL